MIKAFITSYWKYFFSDYTFKEGGKVYVKKGSPFYSRIIRYRYINSNSPFMIKLLDSRRVVIDSTGRRKLKESYCVASIKDGAWFEDVTAEDLTLPNRLLREFNSKDVIL